MRLRSTRFDATVSGSHQIAVAVDVLYNRDVVRAGLAVVSGTVTLDRTAAHRGRCQLTLAEPFLIPTVTGGALTPFGYEVAVKRGVTYPDGTTELMGLGVYPIQQSRLAGVTLLTAVTGTDRSQLVADARFEDDYSIPAGTPYGAAIQALIADGVTGLDYAFATLPYSTPALVFTAQADRWDAARGMATAIGCELYFDGDGTLVLRTEPTFGGMPDWELVEGEGGLLVGADLQLDRGPAYNRVVATGENTGLTTVPRGVWTDSDPTSPTYYYGGFGKKPRFYSSPFIATDNQAIAAATAIGTAQHGVARSVSFGAVPNPALEPGDAVLVKRLAMGVNEFHLIDSLTFDLSAAGAMSGASRSTGFVATTTPTESETDDAGGGGVSATAWVDLSGNPWVDLAGNDWEAT